ncbi:histidine kinase N-terminal domain-containing protein, partial [Microbacterium sp. 13-71-7]|uniref:histidine kinase N-terminal domain-containing protein n=1 Tax=Microbacterium sp. 13-71-7 TaxID=1970399 RepID=UPI000BCD97B2
MSTLSDLAQAQGCLEDEDVEWLHRLASDGQLLADLASADIVIWIATADGSFIAVAHTRPSGAATLFYRDIVGERVRPQWRTQVQGAFDTTEIVDSANPDWFEETPTRVRAVPIVRTRGKDGQRTRPVGVLTRHTNLGEARTPSRQQITFNEAADDLFRMISGGEFPDLSAPTSPRRGAPRASDGLIRIDVDGVVTFASPNALSAFNRMGFDEELEGESLVEVTTRIVPPSRQVDESLPVVVTGRAPWRTDVEARGVTVSLRAIPLKDHGTRIGAIVLCRDVSELRHQEQELITKDATIREIHHRVKN